VLSRAAGVPLPEDAVLDAVERLHADLEQVQQILTEKEATVRLVLTPETVVVAEARRSLTTLSLYGYRVDGVIANRVFPEGGGDAWREGWVTAQQAVLAEVRQSFAGLPIWQSGYSADEPMGVGPLADFAEAAYDGADPLAVPEGGADAWRQGWVAAQEGVLAEVRQSFADLPIWRSAYRPDEPMGVEALASFAEAAYDGHDPLALPEGGEGPLTITRTGTGAVLRIALPFAQRQDVDLARHGDDLVVTVGSYRRLLSLPAALSRHTVTAARVEEGSLQVRFRFEEDQS
jgi:arsenite-transporting ATPase